MLVWLYDLIFLLIYFLFISVYDLMFFLQIDAPGKCFLEDWMVNVLKIQVK